MEYIIDLPNDYVIIDLETTGRSAKFHQIIEMSAIKIKNDQIVDQYSSLVNPHRNLSNFIQQLTNITDEMVANERDIKDVMPEFLNFIGDSIIIGYNISFDKNFIVKKSQSLNLDLTNNKCIDCLSIARELLPSLPHHTLKDVSEHFGIDYSRAHRSLSDCRITFECYIKLKELAIQKYSNKDNFIQIFQVNSNHTNRNTPKTDLSKIKPNVDYIDDTNPFYNQNCVFTGKLQNFNRDAVAQYVVNLGGHVQNNLTKDTNLLIIANEAKRSGKIDKAEKYKLAGCNIEVITENTFIDLIKDYINI